MFDGIKKKVRSAKEEARAGYEKRKEFAGGIFSLWKGFIKSSRERRLQKTEIPFPEAMRNWGFGYGESGIRKGRTITLFMTVFFWAIFFWCSWYLIRSLVAGNYIASVSSLIGILTGLVVGTINLWRWQVIRRRKYLPFPTWIRRGGAID